MARVIFKYLDVLCVSHISNLLGRRHLDDLNELKQMEMTDFLRFWLKKIKPFIYLESKQVGSKNNQNILLHILHEKQSKN